MTVKTQNSWLQVRPSQYWWQLGVILAININGINRPTHSTVTSQLLINKIANQDQDMGPCAHVPWTLHQIARARWKWKYKKFWLSSLEYRLFGSESDNILPCSLGYYFLYVKTIKLTKAMVCPATTLNFLGIYVTDDLKW